jgi:uncharacterized protein YggE
MKLLLLACLSLPVSLLAVGGLPNQPYIYVKGKAEIEKQADIVMLRFSIVARNADQAKANQDVQAKAAKILGMLNDRKIAQNDVIAEDLKSEPQYEDEEASSRRRGKIIGYTVTRSFDVKVRDVTLFAKLVDELIEVGGVEFSSIEGGLSKEKEMQDETRAKALVNAREQAEKTLKATGMKFDSIFAISPVAFPEIHQNLLADSTSEYGMATAERIIAPDPMRYRLAPITISQSVHVIYLISPAK